MGGRANPMPPMRRACASPMGFWLPAMTMLLTGCGALAWLAEPIGGDTAPPAASMPAIAPSAPGKPCACPGGPDLDMPGLEREAPPQRIPGAAAGPMPQGPSRGSVIVRGVSSIGGALTGAPVAWTLAGQLAHLAVGAVAGRRRRRKDESTP